MVKVKICGITNWTDAKLALDAGADALGLNFYAASPRYISPEEARGIVRRLPRRIHTVGVFVDALENAILGIARAVNLEFLQLHGEETPRVARALARSYPVIKAFRVRSDFLARELSRYSAASAFLLDGFDSERRGGTGKTFDWGVARQAKRYGPIILAGGVTPANAARAIAAVQPFAIDVCSGVESKPGKKDARLLKKLMRAVETSEGRLS
jgi:phosphoribosylanthranilate isomerase